MGKLWEALSGWKQIIGTVLVAGSKAVPDPTAAMVVEGLGWLFLGVGGMHRVAKNVSNDGTN